MLKVVPSALPFEFPEGADGKDFRRRRDAHEAGMRGDRARDGGAMRMRRLGRIEQVVSVGNHAGKFRMRRIDAGIDHRDQHLIALGETMRERQPQLAERILRGIAVRLLRRRTRRSSACDTV